MSVYKPAKSSFWHYDFQHKGRRFHGSTGCTARNKALTVEAAEREKAALSLARGETPAERKPLQAPTLDVAANEWWEWKGKRLGRASEEHVRETMLANAVLLVGAQKRVTEIRTADIAEAVRRRRGQLVPGPGKTQKVPANATVNRQVIDTIRPVIRRACKLLEVSPPPIDWGEVRLAEPKPKPRSIPSDGFERLLAAIPPWYHDLVHFHARYACRLEELFFLPEDVDVPGTRVTLRDRKGEDDHTLPLVGGDVATMAARKGRAEAAKLKTVWFREMKSGRLKPLTRGGTLQAYRRAMRDCGLHASQGAKGSHDMRRHGAIEILRATGNLKLAQLLLGHKDIKSTMVYATAVESDLRDGLEAMLERQAERAAGKVGARKQA